MGLHHPEYSSYAALIERAFAEDVGHGDITTNSFIDAEATMNCKIVARQDCTLSGVQIARQLFHAKSPDIAVTLHKQDGERANKGDAIISIAGNARSVLIAERIALNFMSYLSGIATHTAACVAAVQGTHAQILDTRKTLPAYRDLAKYAVRCGGGRNHRMRLDDGVMLKDNHIAIAGNIVKAVKQVRAHVPALTKIEVECDTLAQVEQALAAHADVIMLDNMDCDTMKKAVLLVAGRVPLEASGNMTLDRLAEVAATGVNYISLGALTHSVKAVDFGLDVG
jgi:nicotinate-nucleotide pyrophosphorylase (carboxylating)